MFCLRNRKVLRKRLWLCEWSCSVSLLLVWLSNTRKQSLWYMETTEKKVKSCLDWTMFGILYDVHWDTHFPSFSQLDLFNLYSSVRFKCVSLFFLKKYLVSLWFSPVMSQSDASLLVNKLMKYCVCSTSLLGFKLLGLENVSLETLEQSMLLRLFCIFSQGWCLSIGPFSIFPILWFFTCQTNDMNPCCI